MHAMEKKYGFTCVRSEHVAEVAAQARLWVHDATGAEVWSFCLADTNKVFGVSFRTPVDDSTGVPHILEHSVLCGSEKYPVKEPFVALLKGSLQTFLNAFTYPDKTCYPVASANTQDFYNLIDVYLDAVFYPHISEDIFKQEGWHLETDGKPETALVYKGVVYNEMKGVFSSPEAILSRNTMHALFPDSTYGLESGGDPEVIPELSYEQFVQFHRTHYHPANGRFWFWGDDPEDARLERLGTVLAAFEKRAPAAQVALQPTFVLPRLQEVLFAAEEGETRGMMNLAWVLCPNDDIQEVLSLKILEHILLGMPASPLRKALISCGLGEDLTGDGLEDELRQLVFSVGLKGIAPDSVPAIEILIMETLAALAEDGIDKTYVDAALNSVEFALRERNSGRFPVGLATMLQALTTWLHDGDALAPLRFEAPLAAIKTSVSAGEKYFEQRIKRWFLDNQHRVTVNLIPDATIADKTEAAAVEHLATIKAGLSAADLQELAVATEHLRLLQETPDAPAALARIPMLSVADLPKENALLPQESGSVQNLPVLWHDLPTSGIVYAQAVLALDAVPLALLPMVPLLGRALLEMGTNKQDFVALNMSIAMETGGIGTDTLVLSTVQDGMPKAALLLLGKATYAKAGQLFSLMAEMLTEGILDDKERFLQIVLEEKARLEHSLVPAGHSVIASYLGSRLSPSGALSEVMGGIAFLYSVRDLVDRINADWASVVQDLRTVRQLLLQSGHNLLNITAEAHQRVALSTACADLAQRVCAAPASVADWQTQPWAEGFRQVTASQGDAFILPAQVNYVGFGTNMFSLGYSYHGSALVILKHLRTGWLWEKVRVQGGAYGAMCSLDRMTGAFCLVSYRDPNVEATLDVYAKTAAHLCDLRLSKQELESAIVGAIGELDSYRLPDAKGMNSLVHTLCGDTPELRQELREAIFSTTEQHFHDFGAILAQANVYEGLAVLGGSTAETVAQAKAWKVHKLL